MGRRWAWWLLAWTTATVVGAAVAATFAYWVVGERDLADAVLIGGAAAVAGAGASVGANALARGRVRNAVRDGGPYEVALRLVAGSSDLVDDRWRQAAAFVDGPRLRVERVRFGLRPFRRPPVLVDVLALRTTGRRTPWRSAMSAMPGMPVLEVDVPGARLEIATVTPTADALVAWFGDEGDEVGRGA